MGEQTAIEWTDHTFNPWWGCERVSPACKNCYAETTSRRWGHDIWGKNGDRRFFGDKHWGEPIKWDRWAEADSVRRRVFCASMADVFEDRLDLVPHRERLFELIAATPNLDWLLLTKRPENVMDFVPMGWHGGMFADHPERLWPHNVWIGTTVEDQRRADERIPHLAAIPAPVRFLSCEPLLGPVTLDLARVDWVIVGGESGRDNRPMDPEWARSIRDQCVIPQPPTAFLFKQWGETAPGPNETMVRVGKKAAGRELDGHVWTEFPTPRHGVLS